jgi:hypothetical protein
MLARLGLRRTWDEKVSLADGAHDGENGDADARDH